MNVDLYKSGLGLSTVADVVARFHDTLIDTNRDHKFFVNWDKVRRKVNTLKHELNLLNSLIGSRDFDRELRQLLQNYPQVLVAVPILLALREDHLKVIEDFQEQDSDTVEYDFTNRALSARDIDSIVGFFRKTGLRSFFKEMAARSIQDYVAGIEVGLDTHAHKNRSGVAMELVLKPLVSEMASDEVKVLLQQKLGVLQSKFGIRTPRLLAERKADFILVKGRERAVNIEVNFYAGAGSKPQEIVDSYIQRQQELAAVNIGFIWTTDGAGWKGQTNQISKGFEVMDCILNLHFARKGLLRAAVAAMWAQDSEHVQ